MENSSAGQSMCIGGDGAGVAGLGPPFLSLSFSRVCVCVCVLCRVQQQKIKKSTGSVQGPLLVPVHPLRGSVQERKKPGD